MMIRLRQARLDDEVLFRLVRTELIPLSHTVHSKDAQTIRELPKRFRRGVTYVAAAGKSSPPFGFIHFELTGDVLFLEMLVVDAKRRNQGWGRRLMEASEAYGLAHGCTAARLFVDDVNPRAQRLYANLGYRTIGYYPDLRCYEMMKRLA